MMDAYDMDEDRWACWSPQKGYMSGWMTAREYEHWYWIEYGCKGHRPGGKRMIYRSEADQKEAEHERIQSQSR